MESSYRISLSLCSLASLEAELMETYPSSQRDQLYLLRSLASLEAELMETKKAKPKKPKAAKASLASLEAELMETRDTGLPDIG